MKKSTNYKHLLIANLLEVSCKSVQILHSSKYNDITINTATCTYRGYCMCILRIILCQPWCPLWPGWLHVPRRLSTTLLIVCDPKHNLSTLSSKATPTTVAGNVITHAHLVIRKKCMALSTKEVIVPHSKHSHDGWYLQILYQS